MWNPNSDNNNLKDVSVAETTNNFVDNKSVVGAGASQQHQQKQRKQQMPSNISGNGKTTKTTTTINKNFEGGESTSNYLGDSSGVGGDGHCAADNSSISCSGGIDSGFLSGPQLFEDYDDDNLSSDKSAHNSGGFGGGGKTKQPPVQLNIVHHKKEQDYLDSGCIDEDFVEDDDQGHHQQKPSITTTAASPQAHQQRGTTTVTAATDNKEFDQDEQMILDSGVDAGVSEWMCKLTLRDPNQQVNNLGAAGQRVPNQKEDTSDMSSWEVYYQQNNEGDTQLHLACITGFVDVVAALIRMAPHPCLFNIQNDEAQTSLHLAVIYGQPKILRMLLIAGAEPTARDRHGNTPLHLACISGDTQCVKALTIPISASEINEAHRSYGHLSSDKTTSYLDCARLPADLEIRNYDGERCVHLAAQGGHIDILRHLVWFGADINAREGKSGRTPLHIAIECCNEILANFLLEECSKLNLETATYAGLTAYQVACILDNPTMQNYLEKRGAETLTPPDSDYDSSDIETDLDDSQMFTFGDTRYFANYNGGNPINVA